VRWTDLIDWPARPRSYRAGLQPLEQVLMAAIEASLREAVIQDVLFADGSRDFESLALGFLWVDARGPTSLLEQTAASVIRMLAKRRRWLGSDADGQQQIPAYIDSFIQATTPGRWRIQGRTVDYDWYGTEGATPFAR
jgi:hypothetical protein